MKKFTVPPVVFPSGSNPTTATNSGANFQHRRFPTAPFQPSRSSNPSIPFLSFDFTPPSPSAPLNGVATTTFSDEPSLLEELEINPALILQKTLSLLNPLRVNSPIHDSPDLSGPFLHYMFFCIFQMLARKVQFGVVLGWLVVFSIFLYFMVNMLEGKYGNLDLYRCFSLVGYSFLPILIFSGLSLLVPPAGAVRFGLAVGFVGWATRVCSRLLVKGSLSGPENIRLIAYPCFLIYTLFSMLVLF